MTRETDISPVPKTYIQVDLSLLSHNIRELRNASRAPACMAVVKANAYGHGAVATAKTALACGVEWLAVARVSEAYELRCAHICAPILLFGDVDDRHLAYLSSHDIRITISSEEDALRISKKAVKLGLIIKAHIKIDTGMGRLGLYFQPPRTTVSSTTDVEGTREMVLRIAALEGIDVEGVYTHFANADSRDKTHAGRQLEIFKDLLNALKDKGFFPKICHAANSAATIDMPQAHFSMIRPGIALYGLWPSDEVDKTRVNLKPVMSIISKIIQLKKVPAGYKISYGNTYTTDCDTMIATVPIGYADGYSRLLSSRGAMLVKGMRAPIVGRICMDFTMIDVGAIKDVALGDDVVVMGCQKDNCISADELAQLTGTINYEIVSSLSRRMPLRHIHPEE
ncbi:alanine racemase [Desulfobacula sp.]|uniref:alanine racemase n=1 Tax=Desulfobacula sp. TaxID=2593537 RepID=UPI002620C711|nr:alanine racemase [Desulfobacula sp.]